MHSRTIALCCLIFIALTSYGMAQGATAKAEELETVCQATVVSGNTVDTTAQHVAAGKLALPNGIVGPTGFDWNDTQIGVTRARDGAALLFFASDGSCHYKCNTAEERDGSITRTVGTLDNPLGSTSPVESLLDDLPPEILYVGGGPVYRIPERMPGAGTLILVYHAERATYQAGYQYPDCDKKGFCNGQQNGFYSYLGLASSEDDGMTWRNLGLVIAANQPYRPQQGFDIGNGNLVTNVTGTSKYQDCMPHYMPDDTYSDETFHDMWERIRNCHRNDAPDDYLTDKYFYIYFPDSINGVGPTEMSVARVPYGELVKAIARGEKSPPFHKYYAGEWDEPGLGGLSTNILEQDAGDHVDMSVVWSDYVKRYIGIFYDTHQIQYGESKDGLHWSSLTALHLIDFDGNNDIASYATPVGTRLDPEVTGRNFYVYYNYMNFYGGGWATTELRRLLIDCKAEDRGE